MYDLCLFSIAYLMDVHAHTNYTHTHTHSCEFAHAHTYKKLETITTKLCHLYYCWNCKYFARHVHYWEMKMSQHNLISVWWKCQNDLRYDTLMSNGQ